MNNRAPETYGQGEKGLERLLLTLEGQEGAPAAPGYLGEGESWATRLPRLVPNDRALQLDCSSHTHLGTKQKQTVLGAVGRDRGGMDF